MGIISDPNTYYHSNYHSNEWILAQIERHVGDATTHYPKERMIGCFYQGSGNYGLDYENSDVDTKFIILPSIDDLISAQRDSWCSVRHNNEHTDFKDVRLMFDLLIRQNMNLLEILFTPFYWVNPMYEDLWNEVVELRDSIVKYNRYGLLKSLKGIAGEKFHALEHKYPSRLEIVEKFGYDPKQLHHLIRLEEFLRKWLNGRPFSECLISSIPEDLVEMKKGWMDLTDARKYAVSTWSNIEALYKAHIDAFVEEGSFTTAYMMEIEQKLNNIAKKMIERYLEITYAKTED